MKGEGPRLINCLTIIIIITFLKYIFSVLYNLFAVFDGAIVTI